MVIGKLKYWIEPRPEYTPHCLDFGLIWDDGCRAGLCSRGRWACSVKRELKGKVARVTLGVTT
jgi:hypothetical protein